MKLYETKKYKKQFPSKKLNEIRYDVIILEFNKIPSFSHQCTAKSVVKTISRAKMNGNIRTMTAAAVMQNKKKKSLTFSRVRNFNI